MKKLLILTAVATMLSSSVGCRCLRWLWRGAAYEQPMAPICAPVCDPCAAPAASCDPCNNPVIEPGPGSYAPVINQ